MEKKDKCLLHKSRILLGLLLIFFFLLGIGFTQLSEGIYSQEAAERWQGESNTSYIQNTVFIPVHRQVTDDNIENEIQKINHIVNQEVGSTEEVKAVFAYSGENTLNVDSKHGNLTAKMFGVGEDYFFFHPLKLKAGNYIDKSDIRSNIVLLDEKAAWALFGSSDIVGKEVNISQETFTVVGVVSMEADEEFKENDGVIFLKYEKAESLGVMSISALETVLPEPMTGYASNVLSRFYSQDENEIITNTNRFSIKSIFKKMLHMENYLIQNKGVSYPYYENFAKILECKLIVMLGLILFVGGILLCVFLLRMIKLMWWFREIGWREATSHVWNCIKKYLKKIREKCRRSYKRIKFRNKG